MNDVKVCGERGLVTFCPECKDWRPVGLGPQRGTMTELGEGGERKTYQTIRHGAWCRVCDKNLPKVETYTKEVAGET
jgi:hypothetical protein